MLVHHLYDAQDRPAQVVYNGVTYRYVHNLQGDIIAIVDANGNTVVQYTYGAWGEKKSVTGAMATTLGKYNPFRYRGYVYDEDSYTYGYNPSGELYERWYGPDRLPEMDIHHSDHGHPKYHTNPHKHIWQRDLNGKWNPGKPTNLNDDDKKRSQKGKEMLIKLIIQ